MHDCFVWQAKPLQLIPASPSALPSNAVDVKASGINRADLLQSKGLYPPAPGRPNHLGLEFAGTLGSRRVMGLIDGAGHASAVNSDLCAWVDVPDGWSWAQAAAWPEAAATVLDALDCAGARSGQVALVSAAAGGIGNFAVRRLVEWGVTVYGVCSPAKAAFVSESGATPIIRSDYENQLKPLRNTIDFSLDFTGGELFNYATTVSTQNAVWVQLGLLGGREGSLQLDQVLMKNLTFIGRTLRRRSLREKQSLLERALDRWGGHAPLQPSVWPALDLPLALDAMAHNATQGKQILDWEGYERI